MPKNVILRDDRGIALVAALLLLVGFAALTSAAAFSVVSEKTVTVNHRVGNRALYAADSGVEAAKQFMTDWARAKLDSLNNAWNGNGPIIPEPDQVFPPGGLPLSSALEPGFASTTTISFEDAAFDPRRQAYDFLYTTVSTGEYRNGSRTVESRGRLRVSATRGSFADYLIFTDTHLMPDGSEIWFHSTGHFDGRVHTNGTLRFAYYPTFEDGVTQVDEKAWFFNNGSPRHLDQSQNGNKDKPDFYGGFDRGESRIELPENSFSQQRAALGGNPTNTTPVSNQEIRALLGLPPGRGSVDRGVHLPHDGSRITGGIYVHGKAERVELADEEGKQVYRIRDAGNQVTTIKVDFEKGRTEMIQPDGQTETLGGTPNGVLFVRGPVEDLRGPGRAGDEPLPALADRSQINVVAQGDIVVQNDLTYHDYENGESVLGLFTSKGDVRIGTDAPGELRVDAFVLASGDRKVFTVDGWDTGPYRGQMHLRGGMVTNYFGPFGSFGNPDEGGGTGYGRDFHYDGRGYVPPYFPLTQRFVTDKPEPQILAWREVN